MGWPTDEFFIQSLGTASPQQPPKIAHVEMLGTGVKLNWTQSPDGLRITKPNIPPPEIGQTFKVLWA
jgi:hypothetical protein